MSRVCVHVRQSRALEPPTSTACSSANTTEKAAFSYGNVANMGGEYFLLFHLVLTEMFLGAHDTPGLARFYYYYCRYKGRRLFL